jgi:hypothetical protein
VGVSLCEREGEVGGWVGGSIMLHKTPKILAAPFQKSSGAGLLLWKQHITSEHGSLVVPGTWSADNGLDHSHTKGW